MTVKQEVKHMTAQETYDLYQKLWAIKPETSDTLDLHEMISVTKQMHLLKKVGEFEQAKERQQLRDELIRKWNETHDDLKIIEPF